MPLANKALVAIVFATIALATESSATAQAAVLNPTNGHYYEVVQGGITWTAANTAAASMSHMGMSGHLLTIADAAENQWVTSQLSYGSNDYWIGGLQDLNSPSYSEPAGGWTWVTGEPWTYTSWYPGEPNNSGGAEHFLNLYVNNAMWNDNYDSNSLAGFIVEYDVPLPVTATFTTSGSTCSGPVGNPLLIAQTMPIIGTTFTVDVIGLSPTALPFLAMGFSSASWAGGSLPFPITQLGPPTCSLLVSPDATIFLPNVAGVATWNLALPSANGLLGFGFHNQCIVVAPPTGIAASNRGDAVIGNT